MTYNDRNKNRHSREKSFDRKREYRKNDEPAVIDDTIDEAPASVIFGRNPVIEALKAEKSIDTLYYNNNAGGSIGHICSMARERGIVVKR